MFCRNRVDCIGFVLLCLFQRGAEQGALIDPRSRRRLVELARRTTQQEDLTARGVSKFGLMGFGIVAEQIVWGIVQFEHPSTGSTNVGPRMHAIGVMRRNTVSRDRLP